MKVEEGQGEFFYGTHVGSRPHLRDWRNFLLRKNRSTEDVELSREKKGRGDSGNSSPFAQFENFLMAHTSKVLAIFAIGEILY